MRVLSCLLFLGLVVGFGPLSSAAEGETSLQWITSPAAGSVQAREQGKPMLLYFTTSWCGYCKKLEQTTWKDSRIVGEIKSQFVPIKVDGDKHRELVKTLKVKGFPTLVVVNPDGKELDRVVGYAAAGVMLPKLTAARTKSPASSIRPVSFE